MTVAFNHLGKLGQLGNQMFQYAAAKGVASKLDVPFMIPNHRQVFDDGIGNRYTILLFDAFKLTSASLLGNSSYRKTMYKRNGFSFNKDLFKIDKTENFLSMDSFKQKNILNIFKNKSERILHSKMR